MTDILKLLLEITLFSSAMILVVLSIKAVCGKRIGVRLISVMWILVLVRLIMPVTFESPVHLINIPQATQSEVAVETGAETIYQSQNIEMTQDPYSNWEAGHSGSTAVPMQSESISGAAEAASPTVFQQLWVYLKTVSAWTYVAVVWMLGALILLIKHLVQMTRFSSNVRRCRKTNNAYLNSLLIQNKAAVDIEKPIRIIECSLVDMPVTFGLIKPRILIPKGYTCTIDRIQLSLMIMHELCHIKRHDILKNYLWLAAKIIHWFNPLVLLAFKAYRDDVELACDEMVLRHVSEENKFEYSQGLLEAIKLSRNGFRAPAALSFCKDKTKLRERVETMIQPKKKSKTAAVTAILMSAIMVLACFTTACQPTPEVEVIIGKNDETLEATIHTETPSGTTIEYEDRWIEELQSADKEVRILIDAPVEVPDASGVSVVSIKPHYFTNQEIARIVQSLFGDGQLFEHILDKSDLERGIFAMRADIESLKKDGTYSELHMGSGAGEKADTDDIEGTIEFLEEKLEKTEKEYQNVPDSPEKITDIRMVMNEGGTSSFYAQDGQDFPAVFYAGYNEDTNSSNIEYRNWKGSSYSGTGELNAEEQLDLSTTKEQAMQIAVDFMKGLGIDEVSGMPIRSGSAGAGKECYIIKLERIIDGIPCHTITEYRGTAAFGIDGAEYREPWYPERIEIMIDDTGIIGFEWENPTEIGETINSDVVLKSYEKIREIAAGQLQRSFTKLEFDQLKIEDKTVCVNQVILGMMRISKKDSTSEYYYLPVWDFMGHYGAEKNNNSDISLLTINAIDGSIVDRGTGY